MLCADNDDNNKITAWGAPIRRLNHAEVIVLKTSVAIALTNTPIAKTYIKDLIETVAFNTKVTIISTDILDLFRTVFESRGSDPVNGGIWIYLKGRDSSNPGQYWDWVSGRGFAEIYMNFSGVPWAQAQLPPEQQIVPRYEALVRHLRSPYTGGVQTIHELMHVAVKGLVKGTVFAVGSDVHFADAAAELAGDNPINYEAESSSYASKYWGERLNQACGYPSHITGKMTNYKLYKDKQGELK